MMNPGKAMLVDSVSTMSPTQPLPGWCANRCPSMKAYVMHFSTSTYCSVVSRSCTPTSSVRFQAAQGATGGVYQQLRN